jgi:lipid-binding SYLF domain-containing protein
MSKVSFSVIALMALMLSGCVTDEPKTEAKRDALQDQAQATLREMRATDPGLPSALDNAYAYAVFPSVSKGAVVVGGASGRGIVYQGGRMIGYCELNQATVGAALGGESYSELILFQTENDLGRLKSGNFTFGAEAHAVALKAGASANGTFEHGFRVFVFQHGGLMVDLSLNGQKFKYQAGEPSNNVPQNNP